MSRFLPPMDLGALVPMVLLPYLLLVPPVVGARCLLHRDTHVAVEAPVAPDPPPVEATAPDTPRHLAS